MPTPDDDEFTELVDASIPRVDLVDKAANGLPFLMAKSADGGPAGLIDPDTVRDLIGKTADPEPTAPAGDVTVTVNVTGGRFTPRDLERLARKAVGQRSHALTKDAGMVPETDLDPSVILAEPADRPKGSPDIPGSAAWEAVDAATARKWTSILSRAKTALGVLISREMSEPADGTPDDYAAVMDLGDASMAIDYAISVLAPFAVNEQAEVDCELASVGKALDGLAGPLEVLEALGPVRKAGRSLSARNEQAIRDAVESLQKVLASLPAAPDPQESGLPVAKKETVMSETATAETPAEVVDPVDKAEGDGEGKAAMVAVYDAKGKLVGIVSPDEITPISGADAAAEEPAAAEPAAEDLVAAPAAAVGVPAEGVAKEAAPEDVVADDVAKTTDKTTDTDASDILKSSDFRDMVKGLLDEHGATQAAQLTKTGEAVLELAEAVETLKGQVRTLGEPAEPAVFTNGATPPATQLRGQDRGGAQSVDMAKAMELKATLTTGTAREQNDAAIEMQKGAIAALNAIHGRG
jgi:hypothetical protein